MDQIHKDRFLKLYNHMRQPQEKLGHQTFDFTQFNDERNVCGTSGCMAGELPIIFPDNWYFDSLKEVRIIDSLDFHVKTDLVEFFNIPIDEVYHLFYPESQDSKIDPYYLNHSELKMSATKEEVVEKPLPFFGYKKYFMIKW